MLTSGRPQVPHRFFVPVLIVSRHFQSARTIHASPPIVVDGSCRAQAKPGILFLPWVDLRPLLILEGAFADGRERSNPERYDQAEPTAVSAHRAFRPGGLDRVGVAPPPLIAFAPCAAVPALLSGPPVWNGHRLQGDGGRL